MENRPYLSFIEQSLHYFDRPHQQAATEPVVCPAAWRGEDLPTLDELAYCLSGPEIDEILAAVAAACGADKPILEITADDMPLPLLAPQILRWRQELADGLGFQVIRGVPVEQWSQHEAELFFWCFGLHVGRPGQQNPQGDLLGHVIDTSGNGQDPMARLYKTAANIDYHCDATCCVFGYHSKPGEVVPLACSPALTEAATIPKMRSLV